MSYQTHTPAEWAEAVFLATGGTASVFVPWLLLVDSVSARDFDPRRLLDTRAADRLLVEIIRTRHTAVQARDRARLAAVTALLALALRLSSLPSAPQKDALR